MFHAEYCNTRMNSNSKFSFLFFKIAIFCAFLYSMNCFWFWNFRLPYFNLCALFLYLFIYKSNKEYFTFSQKNMVIATIFFVAQIVGNGAAENIFKLIGAGGYSLIVWILLSMKPILQKQIFIFIYNALAVILSLSLITFFLVLLNIPIPNWGIIVHPDLNFYWYTNYGILLFGAYEIRFNAIFCEPGHLGMILAFLLFVNGYNLKNKATIVLMLSLLCTLSLAGYVLAGIGLILQQMRRNLKTTLIRIVKIALLFFIVNIVVTNYNNGNNLVNDLIFARLEYDSQEGSISGDNRASHSLKQYYESLTANEFLYGIGTKTYSEEAAEGLLSGSGYMLFIVQYGIVAVFIVFIFYLSIVLCSNRLIRTEYIFLFFLYCLCFLQRSYPFWPAEVFTFILANGFFMNHKRLGKFN